MAVSLGVVFRALNLSGEARFANIAVNELRPFFTETSYTCLSLAECLKLLR